MLAFQMSDIDSISGIPYGPRKNARRNPECRTRSKPEHAQVWPQMNIFKKEKVQGLLNGSFPRLTSTTNLLGILK